MRELFPVSPCGQEKSLRKFMEVRSRKESARPAVLGDFRQDAADVRKRDEEFVT